MNKILLSFLGGVTLGVLFAPSKGLSRKQLKEAWDEFKASLLTGVKELYLEGEQENKAL